MAKPPLRIFVSSAVYGYEDLLNQVYGLLKAFGYEVWMSHMGTVPVSPASSAFESCLHAVEACDLFLCIITPRYGAVTPPPDASITHQELELAIRLNKPRWILAHDHVVFARTLLRSCGYRTAVERETLRPNYQKSNEFEDLRLITMYGFAVQDNEPNAAHRTGNWVQKYVNNDDIIRFITAQFHKPNSVRSIVEQMAATQPTALIP